MSPSIEVDIEVFCGRCGTGLCQNSSSGRTSGRQQPYFNVDPCEKCLDEAKQEGYEEREKEETNDRS